MKSAMEERSCHRQDSQKVGWDPKRQKWYHSQHDFVQSHSQLHRSHEDDEHAQVQLEDWDQSANDDDDDGDDGVSGDAQDDRSWNRRRQLKVEVKVVRVQLLVPVQI